MGLLSSAGTLPVRVSQPRHKAFQGMHVWLEHFACFPLG